MLSLFSFLDQPLPSIFKNNTVLCLQQKIAFLDRASSADYVNSLDRGGQAENTNKIPDFLVSAIEVIVVADDFYEIHFSNCCTDVTEFQLYPPLNWID